MYKHNTYYLVSFEMTDRAEVKSVVFYYTPNGLINLKRRIVKLLTTVKDRELTTSEKLDKLAFEKALDKCTQLAQLNAVCDKHYGCLLHFEETANIDTIY